MLWLWIVLISQFCNAGAQLLDKFLLTKKFSRPGVLTFWTAVGNLLGVVFVFWNFNFQPSWSVLIWSLVSGAAFTIALQFLYMGLKTGEASHIAPLVGGVVPMASFVLSYFLLGERLTMVQAAAVGLLVLGALLISSEKSQRHSGVHIGMLWAVFAGVFFAASYVVARYTYLNDTFSTGFVLARLGSFVAALPLLFFPGVRRLIFARDKATAAQEKSGLLILAVNKVLAAIYFIGMNYAISLASATLVNALAGLQYAILFVLIYILSAGHPKFFHEQFTRREVVQEIFALLLIFAGLVLVVS